MTILKTAAIVLNFNTADDTIRLVRKIKSYPCFHTIIIVDNASTDDSAERIRAAFDCTEKPGESGKTPAARTTTAGNEKTGEEVPAAWMTSAGNEKIGEEAAEIKLVISGKNGGYSSGNNLGLRKARAEGVKYALIVNPDVEFDAETADALLLAMQADPQMAVCSPVCRLSGTEGNAAVPGTKENALAGAPAYPLRPWFPDLLASGPVCRRLFTKKLFYGPETYRKAFTQVDVVPGSMLMVDVEKVMEFGGYDENVFLYQEEYILARRCVKAGYTTGLLTDKTYLHIHPPVSREEMRRNKNAWIRRQKLRGESALYYYKTYLGIGKCRQLFTKLFYKIIELEIRCC